MTGQKLTYTLMRKTSSLLALTTLICNLNATHHARLWAALGLLAALAFGPPPAQAAVTEAWVHRYSNVLSNTTDRAVKVVRDAAGDIIVTGTASTLPILNEPSNEQDSSAATLAMPMPVGFASQLSGRLGPSLRTLSVSVPLLRLAAMRIEPPWARLAMPCLTAFSTIGCRMRLGT
jgi:hypothetical protein